MFKKKSLPSTRQQPMTTCARRRSRRQNVRALIALPLAALMLLLSTDGASADGATTLVSVNREGTSAADGHSRSSAISADGRFVAFHSYASDLTSHDIAYDSQNVYLRDVQAGTTTLVSVNREGRGVGNGSSLTPSINASGRYVAFDSGASDLVGNDTNREVDVFVRDVQGGTTTLVSVNREGTASAYGRSDYPVISADGRFVAFHSDAGDLTADDTDNLLDVFVRDVQAGTTTLVSVDDADSGQFILAGYPTISADGRFVAFWGRYGLIHNIYVRDLRAGTTTLVSANLSNTGGGNADSRRASISADGRFVSFESNARDLTADDDDGGKWDVFVRDVQAGTTTLASVNHGGAPDNVESGFSSISADGRFVAYRSWVQTNFTDDQPNLFVRDLRANSTALVAPDVAASVVDYQPSSFTVDGRLIAFTSSADNLAPPYAANGREQVYVRDMGSPAPLIGFIAADFAVNEGGKALVTVTRSGDTSAAASVDYTAGDGSASGMSGDYAPTQGTLTFPAGETRQSFVVATMKDARSEPAETVRLRLFNPSRGAGLELLHTATLKIGDSDSDTDADGLADGLDNCPAVANIDQSDADNDGAGDRCDAGILQLSSAAYSVPEANDSVTITVTRAGGSGGAVFASLDTRDGTAAAAYDYSPTSQTVMFADGDTTPKTVNIPIAQDSEAEWNETVYIRLSNPSGGAGIGAFSTAVLTIVDRIPDPLLSGLALGQTFLQGKPYMTGTVTLNAPAPPGGAMVMLYSSAPLVVTVPRSVTVVEGATTAQFTIKLGRTTGSTSATISATHRYITRSAVLPGIP